jgi:autophagy-related protein 2
VERDVVPGGLNPFDVEVGEEARSGAEPGGISLFATLIERLLSRFEFDARDIRVTIVHPDNVSLHLTLSELKYSTSIKQTDAPQLAPGDQVPGVDRSLAVNGIYVQMKDVHRKLEPRRESRGVHSPRPSAKSAPYECHSQSNSPHSSSSSLDEETMVAMSQSLASLPPRIPPSQSTDNSMYQSALSVIDEENGVRPSVPQSQSISPPPDSSIVPPSRESPDETVFSSGTTPMTVRMITVPPTNDGGHSERGDRITFTLQTGLWACACRPWHIKGLVRLASAVASGLPASAPKPVKPGGTTEGMTLPPAFDVRGSLDHRGVVVLLLPSDSKASIDDLQHFFLHPLIPPRLPSGSMRIYVEGVAASLNLPLQKRVSNSRSNGHIIMKGTFAIHNIDIFVFRRYCAESVSAFPLLFMDPHLPGQYPTSHHHPVETAEAAGLPKFDIVDWTNEEHQKKGAARLSYWRCRHTTRQQTRHNPTLPAASVSPSSPENDPEVHDRDVSVLKTTFEKSQKREESAKLTLQGTVAPIHLLVDLDNIIGDDTLMKFLEEATQGLNNGMLPKDSNQADPFLDDTPPSTPRMHSIPERDVRMQRMIHENSGSEYDYEEMYTEAHGTTNSGKVRLSSRKRFQTAD